MSIKKINKEEFSKEKKFPRRGPLGRGTEVSTGDMLGWAAGQVVSLLQHGQPVEGWPRSQALSRLCTERASKGSVRAA